MIRASIVARDANMNLVMEHRDRLFPTKHHLQDLVLCQMNNRKTRTVYVAVMDKKDQLLQESVINFAPKRSGHKPTTNLREIL